MRAWLGEGAGVPDEAELAQDLTDVEYCFANKTCQLQLERKEDIVKSPK